MSNQTITVLGAGYVGLTTAALLAQADYTVYVVEPNKERLDAIKSGRSFFFEAGIDPIIKRGIDSGTLIATDSYEESVPGADVIFSCVGTPDNPDGSSNLTYVFAAAKQAASLMKPSTVYVQKSTVPVGTGRKIIELFQQSNVSNAYVSNPEFLREGTAVYDTLFFDRVVAGGDSQSSIDTVLDVYRQLESHREAIAQLGDITRRDRKGLYVSTRLNSAELIKVTANAFLALKISFANSIAKLADNVDADIVEVMDAVGADERIGRAFLNAGRGYGGGCFPKDVSGLLASGLEHGVDLDIMQAAQAVNQSMPGYIVEKVNETLGSLENKKVAVLGLSFKAGTSDTRKSPGIAIANLLASSGSTVHAHDPQANEEASHDLSSDITLFDSIQEAVSGADAVLIATDWQEFADYPLQTLKANLRGSLLVDAVNQLDRHTAESAGLTYIGIGR